MFVRLCFTIGYINKPIFRNIALQWRTSAIWVYQTTMRLQFHVYYNLLAYFAQNSADNNFSFITWASWSRHRSTCRWTMTSPSTCCRSATLSTQSSTAWTPARAVATSVVLPTLAGNSRPTSDGLTDGYRTQLLLTTVGSQPLRGGRVMSSSGEGLTVGEAGSSVVGGGVAVESEPRLDDRWRATTTSGGESTGSATTSTSNMAATSGHVTCCGTPSQTTDIGVNKVWNTVLAVSHFAVFFQQCETALRPTSHPRERERGVCIAASRARMKPVANWPQDFIIEKTYPQMFTCLMPPIGWLSTVDRELSHTDSVIALGTIRYDRRV